MSATQVPTEVIKMIDKRRCSFLWAGDKETSAAKYLVAWPNVCTTKELGGLGIKDFSNQNICLLLNLVHRLHCANASAWGNWIISHVDLSNMNADNLGTHWDLLRSLLPLYQAITTIQLGDGRSTSFWSDFGLKMMCWLIASPDYTATAREKRCLSVRRSPLTLLETL